ncbi:MAG: Uma2 family endonuclease [Dehalococcoidia bacterium]|nr:Uma2 family endonuclease [Dehalococcoidia bacterium]
MTTASRPRLLTAEEFMHLPDDPEGRRMELFDGEVIHMPPPAFQHGVFARRVFRALDAFVEAHELGVVQFETGFLLRENPDRIVAPDVYWIDAATLAKAGEPIGYFPGPPTLAIEVISPSDLERDSEMKAQEYLTAGAKRVWLVRPAGRSITVHRPNGDSHRFVEGGILTSDDAGFPVEGFSLPVADVFPATVPGA